MNALRIDVDPAEIMSELDALARLSDAPSPAVTRSSTPLPTWPRVLLSRSVVMMLGCRSVRMRSAIPLRGGRGKRSFPPVGTGSHIDAIPQSGRFDGTVGVIGGLAAIRALRCAGFQPLRPIELVIFTSEEPTRFGIGCLGSRTLAGSMPPEAVAQGRRRACV